MVINLGVSPDNTLPNWALSGGTLVYRQLDGSSGPVLGAAIVSALIAAGWVQTATPTSGVTLKATSPQTALALTVSLDIVWASTYVTLQFHNAVPVAGFDHILTCAAARTFQIVAGPCQFFISQPGVKGPEAYGSNVAGGIPYIAPTDPSYPDGAIPDEVWWSLGDGVEYGSATFRNALGLPNSWPTAWCGYFHRPGESTAHSLVENNGGVPIECIEMSFGAVPSGMTFGNWEPLYYEPLIAWGDYCAGGYPYTGYPPKVRGQIWDAFIASGQQLGSPSSAGIETIVALASAATGAPLFGAAVWCNFSMGLPIGNLYLLLPSQPPWPFGNVAY